MTNEWRTLEFVSPLDTGDLSTLKDLLQDTGSALTTVFEGFKVGLEAAKLFLIQDVSPAAVAQAALAQAIDDLIGSLQETGVGYTIISPDIGNLRSLNENVLLLSTSVTDVFDNQRPITGGSASDITLIGIGARTIDEQELALLWNRIIDALFKSPRVELKPIKLIGSGPDPLFGESQLPDWNRSTIAETIPLLNDALILLRTISLGFVSIAINNSSAIDAAINVIDQKIASINELISLVDSLISGLIAAESLSDGFDMLIIDGTFTQEELREEITKASSQIPDDSGNDVSFLIAFNATTPTTRAVLKDMFGVI